MSEVAAAMRQAMVRLVDAVRAANPAWTPVAGATSDELALLQAAFAPRVLPDELMAMLEVMNGDPSGVCALLDDEGSLLGSSEIVTETALRAEVGDEELALPWSRSRVVITSEGWAFTAIRAGHSKTPRSAVFDLSYGNQDIPVSAASLSNRCLSSVRGANCSGVALVPVLLFRLP